MRDPRNIRHIVIEIILHLPLAGDCEDTVICQRPQKILSAGTECHQINSLCRHQRIVSVTDRNLIPRSLCSHAAHRFKRRTSREGRGTYACHAAKDLSLLQRMEIRKSVFSNRCQSAVDPQFGDHVPVRIPWCAPALEVGHLARFFDTEHPIHGHNPQQIAYEAKITHIVSYFRSG